MSNKEENKDDVQEEIKIQDLVKKSDTDKPLSELVSERLKELYQWKDSQK